MSLLFRPYRRLYGYNKKIQAKPKARGWREALLQLRKLGTPVEQAGRFVYLKYSDSLERNAAKRLRRKLKNGTKLPIHGVQ